MGSNQADVQVSYDVDQRVLPAVAGRADELHLRPLRGDRQPGRAQLKKLAWLSDAAHVAPAIAVLDIGCGWGANLEYLVARPRRPRRPRHHAVPGAGGGDQAPRDPQRHGGLRLVPRFQAADQVRFDHLHLHDRAHLLAPREARAGKSIEMYRNYFRLRPRVVEAGRVLRAADDPAQPRAAHPARHPKELGWVTYAIFPGGIVPRLEEHHRRGEPLLGGARGARPGASTTSGPPSTGASACATTRSVIKDKWGAQLFADYDRYLSTCVRGVRDALPVARAVFIAPH